VRSVLEHKSTVIKKQIIKVQKILAEDQTMTIIRYGEHIEKVIPGDKIYVCGVYLCVAIEALGFSWINEITEEQTSPLVI
jgi:DNA replicative helicase MCM subunit Mcm2 (Cdc46/Mcm family)